MNRSSENTWHGDARVRAVVRMPVGHVAVPGPLGHPAVSRARAAWIYLLVNVWMVPLALSALALLMHRSGWDMQVAQGFFDEALHSFPWRDAVWLEVIGHHLLKFVPIGVCLVALGLALGSYVFPRWRPWRQAAWALAASLAIGPAVVTQLKSMTVAHCPWDLREFGGYASFAADYASSWWAPSRAEAGRCLPSGHAGAGFCLLALYFFAWAVGSRRLRWAGLAVGVTAGLLFGFIRVVQGAHFPSHVMWSAVVCWLAAALVYLPVIVGRDVSPHAQPYA
ncbi:phosphatase PAP2 family protein [Pigmentiphaga aceris]|uniref:Phosphatase PAP2 family protein n=1 Tax=Pigmentiphaga aceris TaxID=1940612 RepID=A0A5C0ASL0_9BURK|nr:phosphatase PAP2 family protein [Pigmentiphaga aceris]QEI05208.1 phosphatase PAP2 family protein [Pigmentiphaga aceris]